MYETLVKCIKCTNVSKIKLYVPRVALTVDVEEMMAV